MDWIDEIVDEYLFHRKLIHELFGCCFPPDLEGAVDRMDDHELYLIMNGMVQGEDKRP